MLPKCLEMLFSCSYLVSLGLKMIITKTVGWYTAYNSDSFDWNVAIIQNNRGAKIQIVSTLHLGHLFKCLYIPY